jgi:CII-binding regulator of phage lambda lysogenization HflD
MSSSRSIAAARQKRANDSQQKMNTSRPVTSIASHNVFSQQYQPQYPQPPHQTNQPQMPSPNNIPIGNKNVRNIQKPQNYKTDRTVQPNMQPNPEQISKISFSDAVGLITLRLSRLETIVNETNEDGSFKTNDTESNINVIPPNMKLITDEIFENIVNRINLLESKMITFGAQIENIMKEMVEVKSVTIENNFTLTTFVNETNEKFVVYENALSELENNLQPASEEIENMDIENHEINNDNVVDNVVDIVNEVIVSTVNEFVVSDELDETSEN